MLQDYVSTLVDMRLVLDELMQLPQFAIKLNRLLLSLGRLFIPLFKDGCLFIEDTDSNIPRHRLRVNHDLLLSLLYFTFVKENFGSKLLLH